MVTKTAIAFQALEAGDVKEALRIFSTFKFGLTAEQRKAIKVGYECIVHPKFYQQLKVDTAKAIENAVSVCNQLRT